MRSASAPEADLSSDDSLHETQRDFAGQFFSVCPSLRVISFHELNSRTVKTPKGSEGWPPLVEKLPHRVWVKDANMAGKNGPIVAGKVAIPWKLSEYWDDGLLAP